MNVEHSPLCRFDSSCLKPTPLNLQAFLLSPDHFLKHDRVAGFLFNPMIIT
nr:hypothetical protein [Klebsiella oxytoca]